jgi:hypothetical protein
MNILLLLLQPKTDDLKDAVLPKAEIPKSLDEENEGEKKVVRKYAYIPCVLMFQPA